MNDAEFERRVRVLDQRQETFLDRLDVLDQRDTALSSGWNG